MEACMTLDSIPYGALVPVAILMALAPFYPVPHLVEKLGMLKNGTLVKPLDIFDLLWHLAPILLLAAKLGKDYYK